MCVALREYSRICPGIREEQAGRESEPHASTGFSRFSTVHRRKVSRRRLGNAFPDLLPPTSNPLLPSKNRPPTHIFSPRDEKTAVKNYYAHTLANIQREREGELAEKLAKIDEVGQSWRWS